MVSKDSHREGRPWKEQRKGSQQEWEEGQSGDAVARLPAGGGRAQIPGFYYDPEKKKYFRILPGHNNYNPLTTAHIQQKQQEETRQELLKQDRNRTVPKVKVRGSTRTASCGPRLLLKRQLGQFSSGLSQRCAEESFLVEMEKQKLRVNLYDSSNQDSVNFLALEPDSKCERLLALSDARRISSCQLDFVSFMALNTLDSMQKSYMQYFTPGKVTGICWASVTGPESHALFSVLDEGPDTPSCARLVCAEVMANEHLIPGPGGAGLVRGRNYEVKSAWTCAWNSNPLFSKCFSIGANNSSVVIDAFTGQRDVINTNSDVFAQRFCNTTPVLLSGTRRGEILGSDLRVRTRCRGTAMTLRHESSVCCLRLLQDENYLLASDMQGKIKLWDLRVQKCILDYPGHVNQYAHIPVIVDSQEKFIFAVGQDCHTRMWNLQDGQLLRTIPSIHPTTQTSRPTIAFSWGWGGEGGIPGLLMGIKDELYWYKLGLSN
ncbi:DDB1- and CUL4-associated factor 4-like [Branchiostoma lanceolatum]|uniref:DDB1- and CUL4-associated factor 4-like n=1 Tax=Branchiostoma lanceolatum TaxID=7740 RepID=UPI0034546EF4